MKNEGWMLEWKREPLSGTGFILEYLDRNSIMVLPGWEVFSDRLLGDQNDGYLQS